MDSSQDYCCVTCATVKYSMIRKFGVDDLITLMSLSLVNNEVGECYLFEIVEVKDIL